MDVHQNAKTTPRGRRLMIQRLAEGWTDGPASRGRSASRPRPWASGGTAMPRRAMPACVDRSSRPHRSPTRLGEAAVAEILALRRQRLSGPAIARQLGRPVSTVGLVLRRRGLGRLSALDPKPELVRYQRERPGELIHLDIKKLGRIDGIGHRITGDRRRPGARHRLGVPPCLRRRRLPARLHRDPARRAQGERRGLPRAGPGLVRRPGRHRRAGHDRQRLGLSSATPSAQRARPPASSTSAPGPTRPRTNGKAERFIQTSMREWAYRKPSPAPPSAPPPCAPGSTATTDTDPTQPLAESHPSPGCPRTTSLETTPSEPRSRHGCSRVRAAPGGSPSR